MTKYMYSALTILSLIISSNSYAQETRGLRDNKSKITYRYDNAGNRVERSILLSSLKKAMNEEPIIDKFSEWDVKIYPNPTKGRLKLEIGDLKGSTISNSVMIYNMNGQIILKQKISSDITDIDISGKSSGIYIMHLNIGGESKSWKIIKE